MHGQPYIRFENVVTNCRRGYCETYKSSKNKIAGTCKENGSGSDAKKDDGRKTVYRKKKRKTSFEMEG